MLSVYVLHGPNLNLLGTRRPEVYGTTTLADLEARCATRAAEHGLEAVCRQSNHEGELVDWVHEVGVAVRDGRSIGAVVNAGAYTHTSIALHDAVEGSGCPMVEVHLSNVHAREPFRHHSYLSPVAVGVVVGFGAPGYALAIDGLAHHAAASTRGPAGTP